MKRLNIQHTTAHRYERAVSFSTHALFLRPLDSHRRRVESFTVRTIPESTQRWVRDAYGNIVLLCDFGLKTSEQLEFHTEIVVSLEEENPYDFILEPYATAYPFKYQEPDQTALFPYLDTTAKPGALRVLDWFYGAVEQPLQHPSVVGFLAELNEAVRRDIAYVRRDEEGIQTPDTTLALRSGSCRDMAVLFIAIARQLGFAARFVSGYLYDPPLENGEEHAFNRALGSMHAWSEIYLPGAGWKGFDPTNGILTNGFFMPSGVSHDPASVNPVQGVYYSDQPTASSLEVELQIQEIPYD